MRHRVLGSILVGAGIGSLLVLAAFLSIIATHAYDMTRAKRVQEETLRDGIVVCANADVGTLEFRWNLQQDKATRRRTNYGCVSLLRSEIQGNTPVNIVSDSMDGEFTAITIAHLTNPDHPYVTIPVHSGMTRPILFVSERSATIINLDNPPAD